MLRSIGAILAGFVFIAVCAFGADMALKAAMPGAFTPDGRTDSVPLLLVIQGYVALFAITGCYLTARLAPNRPMRHALILGALGLVFNIAGSIATWDTAPPWFHVMALALVMPLAWIGGRIREAQLARSRSVAATA